MVSADEKLTAIFGVLDADSTLQGASYLNGTTKIEKGSKRREGISNPTVIMKISGEGMDVENTLQDTVVYVSVFADDYDNGAANISKLSLIANRIDGLLHDATLTISGKKVFNCMLTGPHFGPIWDNVHPNEHYVTSMFRIQTIDLT